MNRFWKNSGPLLIMAAALLWAIDGFLRQSLFSLPPSVIVFYEHLIGAALLAPIALPLFRKEQIDKGTWKSLLVVSIMSGVLGTLFFTAALVKVYFISISVVFLLQKLQPVFAVAAGAILLKEKVTKTYLIWAAFAFVAAYFVSFPNGVINLQTGAGTAMAALLALGAALAWGTSTAFSRYSVLRISNTLALAIRFFMTVPLAFLTVFLLGDLDGLNAIQPDQLGRFVLIACSTGMLALWLYYRGLQKTEVRIATILEFVFPVSAVLLDYLINGTVLAWSQYLAAVCLFFAIYHISKLNRAK